MDFGGGRQVIFVIGKRAGMLRHDEFCGEPVFVFDNHFVAVIEGSETPLTGGEDAIHNMLLIDSIYSCARFKRPGLV